MHLKILIPALAGILLSGCNIIADAVEQDHVAFRDENERTLLAIYPNGDYSAATRIVELRALIAASESRLGIAQFGGTTGVCSTLRATQSQAGSTILSVHTRQGTVRSRYANIALADEIERLHGIENYEGYEFIDTGVSNNFFECLKVGPAAKVTDLIVYLRPHLEDRPLLSIPDIALQIDGRTGNFTELEFFPANTVPSQLAIQQSQDDGRRIGRNPQTNSITVIPGGTLRDEQGDVIVTHDPNAAGAPISDFAYAF